MMLMVCDVCNNEIEKNAIQIAVPDDAGESWVPLDLCSKDCVLLYLGTIQEDTDEEESAGSFQIVGDREESSPAFTKSPLTPDERMDNEKRYKEQAEQLTFHQIGVGNRTKGQR